MHSLKTGKPLLSPESALASEIFDQFVNASTFKSILGLHRQMCETLRIKPSTFPSFYVKLKSKLRSWKAASLWSKLDKRAGHKCYNRGKAAPGARVLIIGAGPCGLRTAIEAQLLGAKVVVIEKRDRFSRNNVLHLWPFVIHDLRNLGAKKFYGKFCAGSIEHISIRQIQCILLKVALLLGVEIHENVEFKSLIEPPLDQSNENVGWHASFHPSSHPVSHYEFSALIGADGKRNTLSGFKKKEFRGKLAIAITANFINKHTLEEAQIEEISGVAFIFNQKFFHDLRDETGIDLENIVYYKDETHYFVMTAKKQSLIQKGVIMNDYPDTIKLLSSENVDREALKNYAREAVDFSTNYKFPHLDFAVNHYGQPDIAMFDFTSMYAAENASQVIERRGHKLLLGLVGDTLLEPFWPTGSGCARGFLSAFDAAWMIRSFTLGKLSVLEVLAERECVYRLLGQTTPENLSKDFNSYSLNPASRYPNLNVQKVQPGAVKLLYDSDVPMSDRPREIIIPDMSIEEDIAIPLKKKRKDPLLRTSGVLAWCQRQVSLYDVQIENMTDSWRSGIALSSILHRYRPDLIDVESMTEENAEKNNKLVFGILEKDYGIQSVMSGKEIAECDVIDETVMVAYITQVYELFRGEIPYVVREAQEMAAEIEESIQASTSDRKSMNILADRYNRNNYKKLSGEQITSFTDAMKRTKSSSASNKRRSTERAKMAQLFPYSDKKSNNLTSKPIKMPEDPERFKDRCKLIEDKIRHDFGMITREERHTLEDENWKRKKPPMPVGKIEREQWNVKMLEEKLKYLREGKPVKQEKKYHVDGSRLTQDVFDNKLLKIDAKLKASGRDLDGEKKYDQFDEKMKILEKKLRVGPDLDVGVRGSNKVASMASQLARSSDDQPVECPPSINRSSSSKSVYLGLGVHGSEICYFCKQRVYLMERMSAEGLFFHRNCFKCEYCGTALRLGGYAYDRMKQFGGKFYCQAHFGMQRVEKQKYSRNRSVTDGESPRRTSPLASSQSFCKTPPSAIPPSSSHLEIPDYQSRGLTPERAEFENSYIDASSEDELSELDEDEWTERNFGSSFEQDTSDDEYSDLSTDSESDGLLEEEVERSMTVDETRRLAERWNRRYSQDTLVDVGGSTDGDVESDSATDVDDSDVFSSDEEYAKGGIQNMKPSPEDGCGDRKISDLALVSSSDTLDKVDKDLENSEFSQTDDYSSYSETESEGKSPVQHEIPEIVIEEMLTKPLDSEEEHLVPEAVKAFNDENYAFKDEKIIKESPKILTKSSKLDKVEKIVDNSDKRTDSSAEMEFNDDLPIKQLPENDVPAKEAELVASCTSFDNFLNSKPGEISVSSRSEQEKKESDEEERKPILPEKSATTIFIKTVTGPAPKENPKTKVGLLKSKCRDDERRHTSPISLRDITRAKEEFLKCGGESVKKRSASPVKKDAVFKTLQSIEQLQRVLESPPLNDNKESGSREALDGNQRIARSLSPVKNPNTTYSSRFRAMLDDRKNNSVDGDSRLSRGYILSKTASTSCVPSPFCRMNFSTTKNNKDLNREIAKTASSSDILSKISGSTSLLPATDKRIADVPPEEMKTNSYLPKMNLDTVIEDTSPPALVPAGTKDRPDLVKKNDTKTEYPVKGSDSSVKKLKTDLLSPTRAKKDDIMFDSESLSSCSTLNDEDFISYKNEMPKDVNDSKTNNGLFDDKGLTGLPLSDYEGDRDHDDLSGSDWAHDEITSVCDDDIDNEFNGSHRFVTLRDKSRDFSSFNYPWDDKSTPLIDEPDNFHAAFVHSISCDPNDAVTPIVPTAKFIESDFDSDTPVVESIPPLCNIENKNKKSVESKVSNSKNFEFDVTASKSILQMKPTSKSLEILKEKKLTEYSGSDDSLYQTPDTNTNSKYKGYTGNFARKISPFGSILDSVLKKREESFGRDSSVSSIDEKVTSTPVNSVDSCFGKNGDSAKKLDKKSMKLELAKLGENTEDRKIVRRRSIHGDTPKNSNDADVFYTPLTSRKKNYNQRPWSVYGTPTETRKVVWPSESTPKSPGEGVDFRQLTSVERDKLRHEARQRARLKSDEELGLSPSYYRRKYSARTESLSEKPENDIENNAKCLSQSVENKICNEKDLPCFKLPNTPKSRKELNFDKPIQLPSTCSNLSESNSAKNQIQQKPVEDIEKEKGRLNESTSSSIAKTSEIISKNVNNSVAVKVATPPPPKECSKADEVSSAVTNKEVKENLKMDDVVSRGHPANYNNNNKLEAMQETKDSKAIISKEKQLDVHSKETSSINYGSRSAERPKVSVETTKDSGEENVPVSSKQSTLERIKKSKIKKETCPEEEKPSKRKFFFSKLSLAKSPENFKKADKSKETPVNASSDSNPTTPKNTKERSFLKLRLSRSKEKFREKKKECDRGEALVPNVHSSSDDILTPITSLRQDKESHSKILVRRSSPPQASDDSFTESEDRSKRFALSAEQLLNRSELTEKIVTDALLGRKSSKNKEQEDRQEKLQKIAKKVQKQQEWKRHRLAQEIQRSLEELDVKRRQLEQQGVELEKVLSTQDTDKDKNHQVMNDWLNMVHQKNKLNNEEQDLLIRLKELQLEDRHSRLQRDLRSRMAIDDSKKQKSEIDEERRILKEMLEIVEEKDALVEVLEENRQKQEKADKEFLQIMQSKAGKRYKVSN